MAGNTPSRREDVPSRRSASPRVPMSEHSLVQLSSRLSLEDGRTLPGGSIGAIVGVWDGGAAYVVEFAEPFHMIVTLPAGSIRQAERSKP